MLKRILLAALLILGAATASYGQFRWGPTAGVNVTTLNWKQDLVKTNCMAGFQAGVQGEVMIPGIGFGIGVGLQYEMSQTRVDFGSREVWASSGFGNEALRIHSLRLPLQLRFKWTRMEGFEEKLAPFAFVGPTFIFNLGGDNAKMADIPFGTFALEAGAGAEIFERWQLFGGYSWGLSYQVRTKKLDNFSARPSGWFIGAAWLF